MTKPTYEQTLTFIENELGIQLFDCQKELLRGVCENKEVYFLPARQHPRVDALGYAAISMLMRKENE